MGNFVEKGIRIFRINKVSMTFVPKLSYHSCDVCRKSITGGGYRCGACDYDVCEECHI
jgi:C1 domain